MRFRWFLILFICGLIASVSLFSLYKSIQPQLAPDLITITSPSPAASPIASPAPPPPIFLKRSGQKSEILPVKKLCNQQSPIARKECELPVGEAYHNIPPQMQVGKKERIEAGIAPKITPEILRTVGGRGQTVVRPGVQFDDQQPVDMQLRVNPDEFKVFHSTPDKQYVTAAHPGKWIWEVIPLKPGENEIAVEANVNLKVPDSSAPYNITVFRETRKVEVNWAYSTSQFVSNNWKDVLTLIIGSGSLAGGIAWWIGKQEQKKKAKEESQAKK